MKKETFQKLVVKAYGLTGTVTYNVNNTKITAINTKTGELMAKKSVTVIVTAKCGTQSKKVTIIII